MNYLQTSIAWLSLNIEFISPEKLIKYLRVNSVLVAPALTPAHISVPKPCRWHSQLSHFPLQFLYKYIKYKMLNIKYNTWTDFSVVFIIFFSRNICQFHEAEHVLRRVETPLDLWFRWVFPYSLCLSQLCKGVSNKEYPSAYTGNPFQDAQKPKVTVLAIF